MLLIDILKWKLIMNSIFILQFNYWCLVWMCHRRSMNNKINRLHETYLPIIRSDKTSSFEGLRQELLQKDGSFTIHIKNLQKVATEMFKVYKNLSRPIVSNFFNVRNNPYNSQTLILLFNTQRSFCLSSFGKLIKFRTKNLEFSTSSIRRTFF